MDTKWKKGKALFSFLTFVTGLTMLVIHLLPVLHLVMACGPGIFEGSLDYQESGEFRWDISNRLSDLLGVATGGMTYSVNGYGDAEYNYNKDMAEKYREQLDRALSEVADDGTLQIVQEDAVAETTYIGGTAESLPGLEAFGGNVDDYLTYLSEQQALYEERLAQYGLTSGNGSYYYGSGGYLYTDEKSYMEDMAKNKNLRYAVIYQNKLLYSNIEEYETKTGEAWAGEDFAQALDAKAYNFTLWYNREGDGKVQITKDGRDEDVYGDGLYTDASRWRVPGYANYKLGEKAKDAVIFLAAAKDPQRYLVAADKGNSYQSYGGNLYRLKNNADYLRNMALRTEEFLTAAVILLAIGLLMRKSRRQAVEGIAGFLGKICLEGKFVSFVLVFAVLAARSGRAFRESIWYISWYIDQGFAYYNGDVYLSGDLAYEFKMLTRAGVYLAIFFWLFYLAVLDWRKNGKKQKKPLLDLLRINDLKYPIQKRLVRRQRVTLIAELVLLTLLLTAVMLFGLLAEGNLEAVTLSSADSREYAEFYAMTAEYGVSAWDVEAPFVLIMEVVFALLFVFTLLTAWDLKKNRRLAVDIGALTDQILAVREGSLTKELTLSEDSDLQEAADNLNQIQKGMETALKEQIKSERMKVDLVTNVSHDIKTPLTSIISYTELLRQEEELPQHVKEYIQILGEKAERLRGIVQDVFEVSKATSGQLPIQMETLDLGKLLRQTLADMNDRIEASSLTMRTTIPEAPVPVMADGQRLYRVFQNLLQNALRYSLEGSRVYLALTEEAGRAVVRIKNTSGVELADSKDFTERFVRGDESRTDGGSGLGLSIAKSFTEACGGSLSVETDADLFTVTVCFMISVQEPATDDTVPARVIPKGRVHHWGTVETEEKK